MTAWLTNISICFDLDGTLVDTAPDLIRTLNEVIAPDGLAPVKVKDARLRIELGAMALIKHAYNQAERPLTENHAKELWQTFMDTYAQSLSECSKPYPGVVDVLLELRREGAALSVCTNKPGYMARPLLEQLGLSPLFDRIVGSGDFATSKPAAQHIFNAAGHRGTQPIIMVGDGAPDAYAAKAAKVPIIMMSYGYSPVSVYNFGADAVLRNFRELPSALKDILN